MAKGETVMLGTAIWSSFKIRVAEDIDAISVGTVGPHRVDSFEVATPHGSNQSLWSLFSSILPLECACVQVEQVEDYVAHIV